MIYSIYNSVSKLSLMQRKVTCVSISINIPQSYAQ